MTGRRKASLFDRIHGEGAFARLRAMLDEPALNYQSIGRRFRISRQRVGQLAKELRVDGRRRQRQRTQHAVAFYSGRDYAADVQAVVRKLKRLGLRVLPYRPTRSDGKFSLTEKRTLLVNGVLCRIYCRRQPSRTTPSGRKYVQFGVGSRTRATKAAVFAFWRGRTLKLYVVPIRDLRNVSNVWLPFDGKYAVGHNIKPKRDWTVYEGLGASRVVTNKCRESN
jgi:hypothetical protein